MFFTHDLVQINPRRVDSLAPGILPAVEHIVQNLDSQMGHTNLIYLRETHSKPYIHRIFIFLGITLQFEMCYTNVLQVLDLSGIPLHSEDRTLEDPFVIGGGQCVYNTEPLAEFFDMFYIGEGEVVYDELLEAYKKWKRAGKSRKEFLEMAAEIEGIYVPSFYDVTYKEDGTIESFLHLAHNIQRKCIDTKGRQGNVDALCVELIDQEGDDLFQFVVITGT